MKLRSLLSLVQKFNTAAVRGMSNDQLQDLSEDSGASQLTAGLNTGVFGASGTMATLAGVGVWALGASASVIAVPVVGAAACFGVAALSGVAMLRHLENTRLIEREIGRRMALGDVGLAAVQAAVAQPQPEPRREPRIARGTEPGTYDLRAVPIPLATVDDPTYCKRRGPSPLPGPDRSFAPKPAQKQAIPATKPPIANPFG